MTPQRLHNGCPKKCKFLKCEHIIFHFKARDLEIPSLNIDCFERYFNFAKTRAKKICEISSHVHNIAKFKINYIFKIFRFRASKLYIICSYFKRFWTSIPEPLQSHFAKITYKRAKSKYF